MFLLLFWPCRKNGSIKKVRLISKLMTCNLVNKEVQYTYCPISHEVKATRQWNLVSWYTITRKHFFKNHAENEAGKKNFKWGKSKWSAAYFEYIQQPSTWHTTKTRKFRKESGDSFSTTFCVWFQGRCFSYYILLNDQISLFDCFISWDIGQYMYCNCLFPILRHHKFWN